MIYLEESTFFDGDELASQNSKKYLVR